MKKVIIFTLSFFLVIASMHAQEENTSTIQKSMTYEEAKQLLTGYEDEFTAKGEIAAFPSLGQQIAKARTKKEVSLATLAYISGLSEENISKIESDKIVPTRDIISKIEKFLGEELVLLD